MTPGLREQVRAALWARSERWYAGLAGGLAEHAWTELSGLAFSPASYGSARLLRLDPAAHRSGRLAVTAGWGRPLLIEDLDDILAERYGPLGLRVPDQPFDSFAFEADLSCAMALLESVPAVARAVRCLVWSVTPVGVVDADHDTSYSDPALPFSIFLSAHPAAHGVSPLRLAEGLLHEAMHLQLSLIEDIAPLVRRSTEHRHSPWQRRPRPIQGLVHGLYVFRVIQDFFRAAIDAGAVSDLVHAQKRIREIEGECDQLAGLKDSLDLTPDGARLTEALSASDRGRRRPPGVRPTVRAP